MEKESYKPKSKVSFFRREEVKTKEEPKEALTTIGKDTLVRGNLKGNEKLVVHGQIEGNIELINTVLIEPSGIVKANLKVQDAIITGVMIGNIEAKDKVEIGEKGRMVGDIIASRVIIVDGALFRGQVEMKEVPIKEKTSSLKAQPTSGPTKSHEEEETRPASKLVFTKKKKIVVEKKR